VFPTAVAAALHCSTAMTASVVLLVEDDRHLRAIVAEVLTTSGFQVHSAADADTARDIWTEYGPVDLLLTDVLLPGKKGPELAHDLQALQPALPVLFMSGCTEGAKLPEGAVLLEKPFSMASLVEAVRQQLARARRPRRALLVDDETAISVPMARYFRQLGVTTDMAGEVEEAAALALHHHYDLAILDLRLTQWGGGEGLQIVDELRKSNRGAAIVILSACVDEETEREARERGADAVLRKPYPLPALARLTFQIMGAHLA
jgi:DNA-binding response OmpR family regulator